MVDMNSPSFLGYIGFIQQNISRMTTCSNNCKTMCIASLVILFSMKLTTIDATKLSLVFIAVFMIIDIMYLWIEKEYIYLYNKVINEIINKKFDINNMFSLKIEKTCKRLWRATISWSILGFYGLLMLSVVLIKLAL